MTAQLSQKQLDEFDRAGYTREDIHPRDEVVLLWVRGITIQGWIGKRCTVQGFTPAGSLVLTVPDYYAPVRVPVSVVTECWRGGVRLLPAHQAEVPRA